MTDSKTQTKEASTEEKSGIYIELTKEDKSKLRRCAALLTLEEERKVSMAEVVRKGISMVNDSLQ